MAKITKGDKFTVTNSGQWNGREVVAAADYYESDGFVTADAVNPSEWDDSYTGGKGLLLTRDELVPVVEAEIFDDSAAEFDALADRAEAAVMLAEDEGLKGLIVTLMLGFAMDPRPSTQAAMRALVGPLEPGSALPEGEGKNLPEGDLLTVKSGWDERATVTVHNIGWSDRDGENLVHLDYRAGGQPKASPMLRRGEREALAHALLRTL